MKTGRWSVRTVAFARTSSYSPRAVESHVMPPPTPYSARRETVSTVTVRIATLNRACHPPRGAGARKPIVPVYTPRGESSSSEMISIVRTFGAPVIEPDGKIARITSTNVVAGSSEALTVDVICQTDSYGSMLKRDG